MRTYEEHEDRWRARGFQRVGFDFYSCPTWAVGKTCAANSPGGCICQSEFNDHGARYKNEDGEKVVLWEPYVPISPAEFARLGKKAEKSGLDVSIMGFSEWAPGSTYTIIFKKKSV